MDRDVGAWLALQALTSADLEANRRGQLSDTQHDRVRADVASRRRMMIVLGGIAATGTCLGIGLTAHDKTGLLLAIPVILAADLIAFYFLSRVVLGGFERDAAARVVQPITTSIGRVMPYRGRNGFITWIDHRAYYGLGLPALGKALHSGDRVTLHVMPRSRVIVAAEPA
jgi:hypothetical protein